MILLELAFELMGAGAESKSKGGCAFAIIVLILTIIGCVLYFYYGGGYEATNSFGIYDV